MAESTLSPEDKRVFEALENAANLYQEYLELARVSQIGREIEREQINAQFTFDRPLDLVVRTLTLK